MATFQPNEDLLRSYLMDLRKFVQKNELVCVSRVLKLLRRDLTSDSPIQQVDGLGRELRDAAAGWFVLELESDRLAAETCADLWLNGHYLHDDAAKSERLEELLSPPLFGYDILRTQFLSYVVDVSYVARGTAQVANVALRDGHLRA